MLCRKGNRWDICKYKVRYTQHGEEYEQYAIEGKRWWENFSEKWYHTDIIEFIEVIPTEDQLERLREIELMPEDFHHVYSRYVETGEIINDIPENHPFKLIALKKQNEEQGQDLTDAELENMSQGQEITDLDLRLMMLEVSQ